MKIKAARAASTSRRAAPPTTSSSFAGDADSDDGVVWYLHKSATISSSVDVDIIAVCVIELTH